MAKNLNKMLDLLSPGERRRGYLLLGMVLGMALLDTVGVGSILPFVAVLSDPDVVRENEYLAFAYRYLNFSDTRSFLLLLGTIVFVALMASIGFRALTTYMLLRFTHLRSYSLSQKLVSGYIRQPYEWFLDRHSSDLGKNVLSEVNDVINHALLPMVQLVAHGAIVVALTTLLVVVNPLWAVVLAVVLGSIYAVIYWLLRRYLERIGADRLNANRERFRALQDSFAGIKEIKVSGLEKPFINRFDGPAQRFARRMAASQVAGQLPRFALEGVAFGGTLLVAMYFMTAPDGLQKHMPLLAVFAFAGYRLVPSLQHVYMHLANLRFAVPALDRLHGDLRQLTDAAEVRADASTGLIGLSKMLKLEDISYRYPGADRPVVNGLTLEIPARSTVGLVGVTGSGKTTTADIILGLLQPQKGKLLTDSVEINADNVRAWQRTIGYVPQTIFLTDDTIAANIAFGQPPNKIDLRAVEHAARIANLHDFIVNELDAGYSTQIGERGIRLSGGQCQRIGIARALYHDPEVLILDEATSALDGVTERAVMEAVHNLAQRKTIIIIAHRLSTVQGCDEIFVLEKGRVVEHGTYEFLIANDMQFRSLATSGH